VLEKIRRKPTDSVKTKDGTETYYKDWAADAQLCSRTDGR